MKNVICLGFLVTFGMSGLASAADIGVPSDFATIQSAVDAASDGDRIFLSPGFAGSDFSVTNKVLTIQGESSTDPAQLTKVSGIVYITDSDLLLKNIDFQFAAAFSSIYAQNSSVRMEDCKMWYYGQLVNPSDNGWNGGLHFENCPEVVLIRCESHGRDGETELFAGAGAGYGAFGLSVYNSDYVLLRDCIFEGGRGGSTVIQQGEVTSGGTGGYGALLSDCFQASIIGCSFTGGLGDPTGEGLIIEQNTTALMDEESSASSSSVDGTSSLGVLVVSSAEAWNLYN